MSKRLTRSVREARELTPEEAAWVRRLKKVMRECPDTLELATMGDSTLSVWCKKARKEMDDADIGTEDGGAELYGAVVATVPCACIVHGVSG